MIEQQCFHVTARVLCEEQLLFVVGKELFGKLHTCVCVRSSAHSFFRLLRMNRWWLGFIQPGGTKERDPNRHSSLGYCSMVSLCVRPKSEPGMTSFRLSLQLNKLYWRNHVHTSTRPEQSSFVCSVHQSATGSVYVYGSSRPS